MIKQAFSWFMEDLMRRCLPAAILFLALTLSGCQLLEGLSFGRGGRAPYVFPVTPITQALMYPGDVVRFEVNAAVPLSGTTRLVLRHRDSDETRIMEVPASELADFTLPLEAETLPGYDADALNRYRLSIETRSASGKPEETGGDFWVVSDRSILPPPRRLIASGVGYPETWSSGSVASLEALVDKIAKEEWAGKELTVTRRELPPNERPTMPRVPADAVLYEFLVTGEFPRYAIPADLSGTGHDGLMTPTTLKLVLSLSEPIYVISTKAFAEAP